MEISLVVRKLIELEKGHELEKIRPQQTLIKELRFDNADLFSLVYNLEEIFGIEIPNEIVDKFRTVKDIIDYIEGIPKEAKWQNRAKESIISYDEASQNRVKEFMKGLDIIFERYHWRYNWKYKRFREKLEDCILRLFYNPCKFYYRSYSPQENAMRRAFDERLEEIRKKSSKERYTGLLSFPGSYEEAFIKKAETYSKPIVKKILKRKVPFESIIPEIERAAFRLWYGYGRHLQKDFCDMLKEQLESIREEIRSNKYISGWDEDLTEELVRVIEREVAKEESKVNG